MRVSVRITTGPCAIAGSARSSVASKCAADALSKFRASYSKLAGWGGPPGPGVPSRAQDALIRALPLRGFPTKAAGRPGGRPRTRGSALHLNAPKRAVVDVAHASACRVKTRLNALPALMRGEEPDRAERRKNRGRGKLKHTLQRHWPNSSFIYLISKSTPCSVVTLPALSTASTSTR